MKPGETDYRVIEADYAAPGSLHDKKLRLVLQRIDACERLLDVGCGTGELIARLDAAGKCRHIYGIDMSDESVRLCQGRFKGRQNINISGESIGDLRLKYPSYFDYILFLDVIEHNDEKTINGILKAAGEMLRPGGKVIVTTPGVTDKLTILAHRIRGIPYKHITGHSSYGWLSVIKKSGLKVLEHRTVEFPVVDGEALNTYAHVFGKCHMIIAKNSTAPFSAKINKFL